MTRTILTKEEFDNYQSRHFAHPQELDRFLNDPEADSNAKLIESLAPQNYEEYLQLVNA